MDLEATIFYSRCQAVVESSGSRGPHTSISLHLLTRYLECVRARELRCQTAHLSLLEPCGAALWDEAILRTNIDQCGKCISIKNI